MSTGVVKSELQGALSISTTEFATLGSMYFYAYFLMQIPSGILADTIGAKKTVAIGSFVAAIGSIMFGLSQNFQMACVSRLIVGLGVSVVFIAILKIQTSWFYSKDFSFMSGLTGFVGNMGAVLAQSPLVILVGFIGWRMSFVSIGVLSIALTIICIIFVKNDPTDIGLPSLAELENRPVNTKKIKVVESLKAILKNKDTWTISVVFFGTFSTFGVFSGTFGVSFLRAKYGFDNLTASNYLVAFLVALAVSTVIVGKISDKMKSRKKPLVILSLVNCILWFVVVFVKIPVALLSPVLIIFGLTFGGVVLCWTVGKEVNNPNASGMSTSVVNCIGFLGSAVIPMVVGGLIDKYSLLGDAVSYEKAFIVLIALSVISFVFSIFVKETNGENIYSE